jgi:hypothetical protein
MLQHHSLIWRDPFSFTRLGDPFVPFEYGSQLLYALVYRSVGLPGITVLAGCLIGATYALMARMLLRRGVDPLLAFLATAAGAILGFPHWMARPHLFSWVAIVLCLSLVEPARRRSLWAVPLLFIIWANVHGGWLYGIALFGIYLVGHLLEYWLFGRRREELFAARYFALAIPLALVATLVTPMGPRLWMHVHSFLGERFLLDNTSEFQSPDFHPIAAKGLLAILLITIAALIVSRRRVHMTRLNLVQASLSWAQISARNLPLFAMSAIAATTQHIDHEWRHLPGSWLARRRAAFAKGAAHASSVGWILLSSITLILFAVRGGRLMGAQVLADNFDASVFPVKAVRTARAANLEGRIFSDFTWGGYLLLAWPEQRVFIDGGTDFYGNELAREFVTVNNLEPGWRSVLERRGIDLVLTGAHTKLARELVRTPGWAVWYCDPVAVLVQRTSASTAVTPDARERAVVDCTGGLEAE